MESFTPEQLLILQYHRGSAAETARATGLPRQRVNDLLRSAKLRKAILDRGFPIRRDPSMTPALANVPPREQKQPARVAATSAAAPAGNRAMSVEEIVAALSAIGRDETSGDRLKAIDLLQKIRATTTGAFASTDKEITAKQQREQAQEKHEAEYHASKLAYRLSIAFATRRYVALAGCEFMGRAIAAGEEIAIKQIKPDSKFFREAPAKAEDFEVKETPAKPLADARKGGAGATLASSNLD